ncbi:MAG: class I SAM-dependent methyltransferase [Myxococcales bacterium]|nr:class I SAM-dependent methyltransferase [Myxococcales bacterium]
MTEPTETQGDGQNRAYYDDFAGWYERERGRGYHGLIDDLEMGIIERMVRGKSVLEAGCGTGLILERLARVASDAQGFDLSPGMLDKARERGLNVKLGSVTEVPYDDNSFDVVCSFKVLAHVPEIGAALAELARVTKPGGRMVLEFYNPWSLRYLAKRVAGPQPISEDRTEADVFTRWDSPSAIQRILPPGVEVVDFRGVRVVTPFAGVHRLPLVSSAIARVEHAMVASPLRYFGGFLVAILEKKA